jgi:hypothetical protein
MCGLAIAILSLLASGCGGAESGNGPTDASRYSDVASVDVGSEPTDASYAALDAGAAPDASTDAAGAETSVDAASCTVVLASSYDQSCTADTDCVSVGQVSVCPATCVDFCPLWTINRNAAAQYRAALTQDVPASPPTTPGVPPSVCSCPPVLFPCCRGGRCQESGC